MQKRIYRTAELDASSRQEKWVADNDDTLPPEIGRIIDALARAAAKRDHCAALKESNNRD